MRVHRSNAGRFAALAVAALVPAALAIGGCGTKTLNTDDVQSSISSGLAQKTGTKPKSVDCPGDVKAEKGGTFTCTLTAPDGSEATVKVTQLDSDGHIRYYVPPGQFK
ncbi:MAG: DUF4333 domain-containing protein [Solirubrobacterales bacterium]